MDKLQTNQAQEFSNFVIFKIDNSKVNIDVKFQDETLWLTQKQLSELFEVNVPAGVPVIVAEDPMTCVARGGGRALEIMDKYDIDLLSTE